MEVSDWSLDAVRIWIRQKQAQIKSCQDRIARGQETSVHSDNTGPAVTLNGLGLPVKEEVLCDLRELPGLATMPKTAVEFMVRWARCQAQPGCLASETHALITT